jgi:hypothetical protein
VVFEPSSRRVDLVEPEDEILLLKVGNERLVLGFTWSGEVFGDPIKNVVPEGGDFVFF